MLRLIGIVLCALQFACVFGAYTLTYPSTGLYLLLLLIFTIVYSIDHAVHAKFIIEEVWKQ